MEEEPWKKARRYSLIAAVAATLACVCAVISLILRLIGIFHHG
jgi:hypothetical protein